MIPHLWICLIVAACAMSACSNLDRSIKPSQIASERGITSLKLLPKDEKTLLIIGQDIQSIEGYSKSDLFPVPGGVTTYLSFYQLTSSNYPEYGAIGVDNNFKYFEREIDWGAGPLNAAKLARNYPNSALIIGLNIAEGSGGTMWAPGGLADIAVGVHDNKIEKLAGFLKSIPNPVYLRIGYEFDGIWNSGYQKKTSYILAFKRIVDVLRQTGVTNTAYVWQASASPVDDVLDGYSEDIKQWYPGDDYVDWMAFSWFLFPDESNQGSPTQMQLADQVINFSREKNKPVMIAESAPQRFNLKHLTFANASKVWDGPAAENKKILTALTAWEKWFIPFFNYIETNRDAIRAVAYINANWDDQSLWSEPYNNGYWGDSRLELNSDIAKQWFNKINDGNWLHANDSILEELGN